MNVKLKAKLYKLLSIFGIEKRLYSHPSYSQEGEDMILRRFVGDGSIGFYIDIGAHHPYRFSNTYFLYHKGWRGINIDPLPGAMELFKICRPRDINLTLGIAATDGALNYFMFNEPALNTFDKNLAKSRESHQYKIIDNQVIPVTRLETILENHQHQFRSIDLLTVDVEGLDLEVLQSNNWSKFRPRLVVVESLQSSSVIDVMKSEIYKLLIDKEYALVAKSFYSCIFLDQSSGRQFINA